MDESLKPPQRGALEAFGITSGEEFGQQERVGE
jgi:hypothetical protein